MNTKTFNLICATLLAIATTMSGQSQNPGEILRRVENNMHGDASLTEMTMTTVRPRFTREVSMKAWTLGEDYSLILITAPARDQGTAFLKRGKEIWNYVPNIDRTVKMPPSMMAQSWMGSDFSNDDLVRGTSTVDDFTHRLMQSQTVNGLDCYVLELIPRPDAPIVYGKVIYYVSKQHYLPVKVENFDETGSIANTIHFRDIKNMGGRNLPTVIEIVPAKNPGHKTIITTRKADFNIRLTPQFFTLQNLTRVR